AWLAGLSACIASNTSHNEPALAGAWHAMSSARHDRAPAGEGAYIAARSRQARLHVAGGGSPPARASRTYPRLQSAPSGIVRGAGQLQATESVTGVTPRGGNSGGIGGRQRCIDRGGEGSAGRHAAPTPRR